MRRALCMLALGVTASLAAPAAAQSSRDAQARSHYERGSAAFDAARYDEALTEFRAAYEISRRPALQWVIGLTCERLERREDALAAFELYVRSPDAEHRAEAETKIAALREAAASRDRPGPEPEPTPEAPAPAAAVGTARPAPGPADRPASDDGGSRVWTWIVGGVAVALGGVALALKLSTDADYDELQMRCVPMGGCSDQEISDSGIERNGAITASFAIASGAALVTAIVLFFVEGGSEREEPAVALDVGLGSIRLAGRFR